MKMSVHAFARRPKLNQAPAIPVRPAMASAMPRTHQPSNPSPTNTENTFAIPAATVGTEYSADSDASTARKILSQTEERLASDPGILLSLRMTIQ